MSTNCGVLDARMLDVAHKPFGQSRTLPRVMVVLCIF